MKILFLGMDFCKYGPTSRSTECYVAEEMAKENEVIFCTKNMPVFKESKKPNSLTIKLVNYNDNNLSEGEIRELMSYDYNVVYTTSISSISLALKLSQPKKAKCVVQVLDCPIYRLQPIYNYKNWIEKWKLWIKLLPQVDAIVCNHNITSQVIIELGKHYGVEYSDKLSVVPYGIATMESDKIPPQEKKNQVVFVSNLRFFKGLEIIIYALAQLKEKPLLKVVGVSDGTEQSINTPYGPIHLRYINLAFLAGIPTVFCGGVGDNEKYRLIKESKLALLPLLTDTIPSIFPLEAVYSGTPALVSDTDINKEAYGDNVTYLNRFNTRLWANKIQEILNDEKYNITPKMREFVLNNRSCKSHADGLLKVFQGVLDGTQN